MKLDNHKQSCVNRNLCKIQDLVDEKKQARLQHHLDKEKKGKVSRKLKEAPVHSRRVPQVLPASQPVIDKDDNLNDAPPDPVPEKETTPPSSFHIIPTTTISSRSPSEEVDYSNSPIILST
jgi:hypothetical protein